MNDQSEFLTCSPVSADSPLPQKSPTLWPTPISQDAKHSGHALTDAGEKLCYMVHDSFPSPTPKSNPSPAPSITSTFPIRYALEESRMLAVIRSLSDAVYCRMLSAGASRASRTVVPGSDSPAQTIGTCGASVGVFLGTFDHASRCLKTSAACLQASQDFFSTAYLVTWPRFGTLVSGRLYQQAPLGLRTGATESGCYVGTSWPTPTKAEGEKIGSQANYGQIGLSNHPAIVGEPTREKGVKSGQPSPATGPADRASRSTGGSQAAWFTPSVEDAGRTGSRDAWEEYEKDGKTTQARLRNQIWATPQASDPAHAGPNQRDSSGRPALPAQVGLWATPRANKVHPEITEENREHLANRGKTNLEEDVAGYCGKATGKLNPHWVFALMGYPPLWAELGQKFTTASRNSKPRATP
jgi:hypothetical protein